MLVNNAQKLKDLGKITLGNCDRICFNHKTLTGNETINLYNQ